MGWSWAYNPTLMCAQSVAVSTEGLLRGSISGLYRLASNNQWSLIPGNDDVINVSSNSLNSLQYCVYYAMENCSGWGDHEVEPGVLIKALVCVYHHVSTVVKCLPPARVARISSSLGRGYWSSSSTWFAAILCTSTHRHICDNGCCSLTIVCLH